MKAASSLRTAQRFIYKSWGI